MLKNMFICCQLFDVAKISDILKPDTGCANKTYFVLLLIIQGICVQFTGVFLTLKTEDVYYFS